MLKDKALKNLAAGELLLGRGCPSAAASRLYYAMYQAAVHRLTALGVVPGRMRSGAVEWDHSMVLNNLSLVGARRLDRVLYAEMRRLRGEADYGDDPVRAPDLDDRQDAVRELVRRLTR